MSKELSYQELREALTNSPTKKKQRHPCSRKAKEPIILPTAKERKEIRAAIAEANRRRRAAIIVADDLCDSED